MASEINVKHKYYVNLGLYVLFIKQYFSHTELRPRAGEHEGLCGMKRRFGSESRLQQASVRSPPAGFEAETKWSEVASADLSTMQTLLNDNI